MSGNFEASRLFSRASGARFLPLLFALLCACPAPPTQQQVTSRAVARNCEAQADIAANEIRKENVQVVKEGSAVEHANGDIEAKANRVRQEAFKNCMLKYAV